MSALNKLKKLFLKKETRNEINGNTYDENNFETLNEFENEGIFPTLEWEKRLDGIEKNTRISNGMLEKTTKDYGEFLYELRHSPFAALKGSLGAIVRCLTDEKNSVKKIDGVQFKNHNFQIIGHSLMTAFKSTSILSGLIFKEDVGEKSTCFDTTDFSESEFYDSVYLRWLPFATKCIEQECNAREEMKKDIKGMERNPTFILQFTLSRLLDLYYKISQSDDIFIASHQEMKYLWHHINRSFYMTNILESYLSNSASDSWVEDKIENDYPLTAKQYNKFNSICQKYSQNKDDKDYAPNLNNGWYCIYRRILLIEMFHLTKQDDGLFHITDHHTNISRIFLEKNNTAIEKILSDGDGC